jgi:hypothetical protein
MKRARPKMDRAVLGFLQLEALRPTDFTNLEDGVVRFHPELRGGRSASLGTWNANNNCQVVKAAVFGSILLFNLPGCKTH